MVSLFFLRDIVSVIHLCHYMYETRSWHTYSYALGFAFLKSGVTEMVEFGSVDLFPALNLSLSGKHKWKESTSFSRG